MVLNSPKKVNLLLKQSFDKVATKSNRPNTARANKQVDSTKQVESNKQVDSSKKVENAKNVESSHAVGTDVTDLKKSDNNRDASGNMKRRSKHRNINERSKSHQIVVTNTEILGRSCSTSRPKDSEKCQNQIFNLDPVFGRLRLPSEKEQVASNRVKDQFKMIEYTPGIYTCESESGSHPGAASETWKKKVGYGVFNSQVPKIVKYPTTQNSKSGKPPVHSADSFKKGFLIRQSSAFSNISESPRKTGDKYLHPNTESPRKTGDKYLHPLVSKNIVKTNSTSQAFSFIGFTSHDPNSDRETPKFASLNTFEQNDGSQAKGSKKKTFGYDGNDFYSDRSSGSDMSDFSDFLPAKKPQNVNGLNENGVILNQYNGGLNNYVPHVPQHVASKRLDQVEAPKSSQHPTEKSKKENTKTEQSEKNDRKQKKSIVGLKEILSDHQKAGEQKDIKSAANEVLWYNRLSKKLGHNMKNNTNKNMSKYASAITFKDMSRLDDHKLQLEKMAKSKTADPNTLNNVKGNALHNVKGNAPNNLKVNTRNNVKTNTAVKPNRNLRIQTSNTNLLVKDSIEFKDRPTIAEKKGRIGWRILKRSSFSSESSYKIRKNIMTIIRSKARYRQLSDHALYYKGGVPADL